MVAYFGDNSTTVFFTSQLPTWTDNSGNATLGVMGAPSDYVFYVGHTRLTYVARDPEGNEDSCVQTIHVKGKASRPGNVVVERLPGMREVSGSIPGSVKQKTLKFEVVLLRLALGT